MATILNTESSSIAFITKMDLARYVKISTNLIQTQRIMLEIKLLAHKENYK
jgi:hypothetical protein